MGSCNRRPLETQLFEFRLMYLSSIPSKSCMSRELVLFYCWSMPRCGCTIHRWHTVHLLTGFWLISHLGLVQINLQEWLGTGFCVDITHNFSRANATARCWVVWVLCRGTLKKGTSQLFPGMVISLYTCFGCLTAFEIVTRFCKNSSGCAEASHCVLVCVFLISGGIETEPLFMCLLAIHVVIFIWC